MILSRASFPILGLNDLTLTLFSGVAIILKKAGSIVKAKVQRSFPIFQKPVVSPCQRTALSMGRIWVDVQWQSQG